jgi:hypothetical protein
LPRIAGNVYAGRRDDHANPGNRLDKLWPVDEGASQAFLLPYPADDRSNIDYIPIGTRLEESALSSYSRTARASPVASPQYDDDTGLPFLPRGTMSPLPPSSPGDEDHLEFDGRILRWIRNGEVIRSWDGVSGANGFQSRENQDVPFKGPLPEGNWSVRQEEYQEITPDGLLEGVLRYGKWVGALPAWGAQRVWIKPERGTNTRGRSNFSIHGGWVPGSAGCIDLTDDMEDFARTFREFGRDLTLRVRYPDK